MRPCTSVQWSIISCVFISLETFAIFVFSCWERALPLPPSYLPVFTKYADRGRSFAGEVLVELLKRREDDGVAVCGRDDRGLPELPPPTTDLLPDPAVCGLAEGTRCFAWPAIVSHRGPAVCGLAEAFGRVSLPAYSALSDRDDPAVCGRTERRPVWFGEPLLLLVLLWSIWTSLAELAGFLLREDDGCAVCGLLFFGVPRALLRWVFIWPVDPEAAIFIPPG